MKQIIALLALLALAACSTTQLKPIDFTQTKLATVTHNDLQAAAKRAAANGYQPRADFWLAVDTLLTAQEKQATACAAAIEAALPKAPATGPQFAGAADALEAAAETVGNFSGIPANVKILCEPLPIPALPLLPGIPKL